MPALRVLFVMRSPGFLRNFENALRALLADGHAVTVAIERGDAQATYAPLRASLARAGVTFGVAPSRADDVHHRVAVQVRVALDYLSYLAPLYDDRPKLRARAAAATIGPLRVVVRRAARGDAGGRRVEAALRALDRAAPRPAAVDAFLDAHPCDVLLVTPLVELGAPQTDWLRAARERGIPTVLGVASWDNLTVKGRIREAPDRVLVWNDEQRDEASALHAVPPERVTAVGAHTYDHWFAAEPSRDRAAFCRTVGLPDDRPIVLYLCSSPFIAPGETEAVREWLRALREAADPVVREAAVLVRPHPQHAAQWEGVDLSGLGPVAIWPRAGGDPVNAASRADFFDSMAHCAAVCGVNTSALIESTIVGRPVGTVLTERYNDTQEGTLHFAHLADAERGILSVARSPAEHHAQLSAAITGDAAWETRRASFLRRFVRPAGLEVPAAPLFAAAVVAVSESAPVPQPGTSAAAARLAWRLAPLRPAIACNALLVRLGRRRAQRRPALTVGRARKGARRREVAADRLVESIARRVR